MMERVREELRSLAHLSGVERERVLVTRTADAVLRSKAQIPALPTLARRFSERVAERAANPRGASSDSAGEVYRRRVQWDAWHGQLVLLLHRDGVDLLADLARLELWEQFRPLCERVEVYVRSLRQVELPWWQTWREERHTHRRLSIVDWADLELGRLTSQAIRAGGYSGRAHQAHQAHQAREAAPASSSTLQKDMPF